MAGRKYTQGSSRETLKGAPHYYQILLPILARGEMRPALTSREASGSIHEASVETYRSKTVPGRAFIGNLCPSRNQRCSGARSLRLLFRIISLSSAPSLATQQAKGLASNNVMCPQ